MKHNISTENSEERIRAIAVIEKYGYVRVDGRDLNQDSKMMADGDGWKGNKKVAEKPLALESL